MTEDRYIRLQDQTGQQLAANFPLLLERYALLLDRVTQNVILQCKLKVIGISYTDIQSVMLIYTGMDENGKEVDRGSYKYKDVHLLGGESFGSRTPIVVNASVRTINVSLENLTLVSGETLAAAPLDPFEQNWVADLSEELLEQLRRDKAATPPYSPEPLNYLPLFRDQDWICTCGWANPNTTDICNACSHSRKWLVENLTEDHLQASLDSYNETQEALRLEKEQKALEDRAFWAMVFKRFVLPVVILAVFVFVALTSAYLFAGYRMSSGDYQTASQVFPRLLGIYNSDELAKASRYQYGVALMKDQKYDEAKAIFKDMGDYSNAKTMILDTDYRHATDAMQAGDLSTARALFSSLATYSDSQMMVVEIDYRLAKGLLNDGKLEEAKTAFEKLRMYKDSPTLVKESKYQIAEKLMKAANYEKSSVAFHDISSYKDSASLASESIYLWGKQLLSKGDAEKAIPLFQSISTYKDAADNLKEARYTLAASYLAQNKMVEASKQLTLISGYKDADDLITKQILPYAMKLYNNADWENALAVYKTIDQKDHPEVTNFIMYAEFNAEQARKKVIYDKAVGMIANKQYKEAYNLLKDLKYSNSDALVLEYATIAYPWHVSGNMSKSSYSLDEHFLLNYMVTGGPPGATIDITVTCKLPNGSKVEETTRNVTSGSSYSYSCWYSNWWYGSTGSGSMKVRSYFTGETLALSLIHI